MHRSDMIDASPQLRLPRSGLLPLRGRTAPLGHVDHVAWLTEGSLLVIGWLSVGPGVTRMPVEITLGGGRRSVTASVYRYRRPDLKNLHAASGVLVHVPVSSDLGETTHVDRLSIEIGGGWFRWLPRRGKPIAPDLTAWTEESAPILSSAVGSQLRRAVEAIVAALPAQAGDSVLQANLGMLSRITSSSPEIALEADEALARASRAEEIPGHCLVDPTQSVGIGVEAVVQARSDLAFVRGWLWDPARQITGLFLMAPGLGEVELRACEEYPREDVAATYRPSHGVLADTAVGFCALAEAPWLSSASRLLLRVRRKATAECWLRCPPWYSDPFRGRDIVLGGLQDERFLSVRLVSGAVQTALAALSARCRAAIVEPITMDWDFRVSATPPRVSVIIPIVSWHLLEPQLAAIAESREGPPTEILYIADVEGSAELERRLFSLARFYGLAVRLACLDARQGWAAAVESGARASRGEVLGLLHADVFGFGQAWISRMVAAVDDATAAGPTLVAEDGSLLGGPVGFRRDLYPDGLWSAYTKGAGLLPEHTPAIARPPIALSGAALFLRRRTYFDVGGIRDLYAAGDGDDHDLCLRCVARGGILRHVGSVELLHLGGQDRIAGPGWRRNPWAATYNRLLLTERWGDDLTNWHGAEVARPPLRGGG